MSEKIKQSVIRIEDVKEGSLLVTDGGFTCMGDHDVKLVKAEPDGSLYVDCKDGHHGLDGQECSAGEHGVDFDHYIGFWLEGTEPPVTLADKFKALLAQGLTQSDVLTVLHEADDSLEAADKGALIEEARNEYANDEREIDDNALFSVGDDGVWVSGWFWVPRPVDEEPEEAEPAEPVEDSAPELSTYGSDTRRGELSDDLGESPDF